MNNDGSLRFIHTTGPYFENSESEVFDWFYHIVDRLFTVIESILPVQAILTKCHFLQ